MNHNNILTVDYMLLYMIDYSDTVKYDTMKYDTMRYATMKVIQYNINDINR